MRGVSITRPLEGTRVRQPILGELPDGLEQAVPGARGGVVGDDERLADQRVEVPQHVHLVGALDHGKDARQVEAAGEDRRGAQQLALVVGQQVVRPVHGVTERLLALRPRFRTLQETEAIGESIPDLMGTHGRHPRRSQLDS
jgi:hypothetical protein